MQKSGYGNWAIACKNCGRTLVARDTTIDALRKVALTEGWRIGDGYQHCADCKKQAQDKNNGGTHAR